MKLHTIPGVAAQLQGATLVVPAISIGNVGQLAVDLIVATSEAPRCGILDDGSVLPCAGADAFSHVPGLALAMELFVLPGSGVFVLQQRAPAAPGLQRQFAEAVAQWAQDAGFAQVWVLGSLDATVRCDAQLAGSQLRCWATQNGLRQACNVAGVAAIEDDFFKDKAVEDRLLPPWPLLCACQRREMPGAALLTFAAEGNNVPDALQLADAARQAVPGLAAALGCAGRWTQPPSWALLFGPHQEAAY